MSSFKEAVIVPLPLFKTASFAKDLAPGVFQLPVDQRLKIMQSEKYYQTTEKAKDSTLDKTTDKRTELMKESMKSIIQELEQKDQPVARSILNKLIEDNSPIKWNPSYEIVVHGKTFPGSDIRELLKYVLNYKVITSDKDYPKAHERFTEELLKLVPKVWLKIPRRRAARRGVKRRRLGQKRIAASSDPWIPYSSRAKDSDEETLVGGDSDGDDDDDAYLTP